MKLRNKMFLVLGGATFLVAVVVIFLSLWFFFTSFERIQNENSRQVTEQLRSSVMFNMARFQDTVNLYLVRVSTFLETVQKDDTQLPSILGARFQYTAGTDCLLYSEIARMPNGKFSFSSVLGFQDVHGKRDRMDLSQSRPDFLESKELQNFLLQKDLGTTAVMIFEGHCWITSVNWTSEQTGRMIAVRIDQHNLKKMDYQKQSGIQIYQGDQLLFDSCQTALHVPDEIMKKLRRMEPASGTPRILIFHDDKHDGKWLASMIALNNFPNTAEKSIRIVRLFDLHAIVPPLNMLLKQEFEQLFLLLILLSAAGFLLLLLLPFRLTREIADPLSDAVRFADTLANGAFPAVAETHCGIAEVDQLMKSLNHMRDRLNSQISKLKRSHGRELIARQDAELSNRLKMDFLNSMSAEYRENLNSISGFLEFMTSQTEEEGRVISQEELVRLCEAMKSNLSILKEIGRILHELVILDDPAASVLKPGNCDFYQILRNVNEPFSATAEKRKIMMEFHFASDTPSFCFMDGDKFTRMLSQITRTLLYSTPEGERIELYSKTNNGRLIIGVNGSTVNAVPLEFILYHTAKRRLGHFQSALGVIDLTIARQLAHLLGGEMDVSCQDDSYRIELSFPLSELVRTNLNDTTGFFRYRNNETRTAMTMTMINRKEFTESLKRRKESGAAPLKILLAEDDDSTRMLLHMMLRDAHCDTADACDTFAVQDQIHVTAFDILILNLHMPSLDRFPFLKKLRQISCNPNLYIIVFSAYLEDGDRERLISAGANQCLLSPVVRDELIGAVQNAFYFRIRHERKED